VADETVQIQLEGGPCAGRNATVKRTGDLLPGYTCQGTDYQPTAKVTSDGRVIYTTKASQQKPPTPVVRAAHAHGGYADLQRTVNVHMPTALHAAQRSNKAALQSLARARKVRL